MTTLQRPHTTFLKEYRPPDFTVDSIELQFDLHEGFTQVRSILQCRRNTAAATPHAPLRLNGEQMVLKEVLLDGQALTAAQYQVDEIALTIPSVSEVFCVETLVEIKPHLNKALSGLYQSNVNFCTQCEAEGFRRITYFLDRPDVMTRFTTTLTADKTRYPFLLSNGNCVAQGELSDNRHWVRWEDPSLKPCYLFALVAGDFDLLQDRFTTGGGRVIDLRLYLEKGFSDQGRFALEALKSAMRWDEEKFLREYDLAIYMIVAVSDFNMGAMENKGLNIFNTRYILAKPETATDRDYTAIESVIGHEYFHNWTGNRITCRDWFQLTLKEGLTVFRDQLFTEDRQGLGVSRMESVDVVLNAQFPEDAGPMAHPIRPDSYIEINNFYTHTVYRKGAEVIRMIRTLIGADNFFKGMQLYFSRHDGSAVTTEDFVKAMEDASNYDLRQFRRWYDQAGTPQLDVESDYDAKKKQLTLTVTQRTPPTPGQPKKEPFYLPLAMGFISQAGQSMPVRRVGASSALATTCVLPIALPQETFSFSVEEKPVLSLLRNFSAPVKLQYAYTDEELLWLFQCDRDLYCRYAALQQFVCRFIERWVLAIQKGEAPRMDARLTAAYQKILSDDHEDPHVVARLLSMPSLSYLVQQIKTEALDTLYEVCAFIEKSLSIDLSSLWLQRYEMAKTNSYQFTKADVGLRALKNQALYFLTAGKVASSFSLAYQQFECSDNMTDTMGALFALNDFDTPLRYQALEAFYERWKHQPLIVNKWLSLHASSKIPETITWVKKYLEHPAFDIENPNKVYALLGGFGANVVRFHDRSGEGYRLIADYVLKIDPINPQVAARILQPLIHFGEFDVARAKQMKQQLSRILANGSLSCDVYELVEKSLA